MGIDEWRKAAEDDEDESGSASSESKDVEKIKKKRKKYKHKVRSRIKDFTGQLILAIISDLIWVGTIG